MKCTYMCTMIGWIGNICKTSIIFTLLSSCQFCFFFFLYPWTRKKTKKNVEIITEQSHPQTVREKEEEKKKKSKKH